MITITKQTCIGYQRSGAAVIENQWSDGHIDYSLSGDELYETDVGIYSFISPSTPMCPHIDVYPSAFAPSNLS